MKNSTLRLTRTTGLVIATLWINAAVGQESANANTGTQGQAFVIKPRITLIETWTDNVAVSGGQGSKESGFITQLAPGVRIDAKTARLKAYFDYALTGTFYSTSSANSSTQNSLNTFGTLEAVSNWMYLDFSGLIAQQTISAFGAQSPSNANINTNSSETSTYRLSPYIRGQIAGVADYTLRYNWSTTQSNTSAASDIELSDWAGLLHGSTPFQNLKWSVNATQQNASYSRGQRTEAQRLYAIGTYTVVPQFRVSLSGGQESNNYASQNTESKQTHGYGFDWTPTERTQISAFKERRFFGDGHRYSLSHRFPLSSIRYSDTKDVSVMPPQSTVVGLGTLFDLVSELCRQQYINDTDPNQLDQVVSTCANNWFINRPGFSPNALAYSGFLSSRATILRSQQLALALQGVRNTLTLLFNRSESQSTLASSTIGDDFSSNNTNNIRQRGISFNLSHKLSAISSINIMASRQESTSTGTSALKATTMMYQANLTSKLGAKTTGGLSIRRTEFDNSTNAYTENALIGTLSVIF
ncbi:TIGR03016 family PEP-CTERM system-associated outer membrane protein [Ferribacterium limneticum]|uniref:TIGR03016 family PEP-CTERM system-associated outer membrane protein n=1 Tax=Ferribacterium limneticum TaxID=76259 RepID=UPI001CF9A50B|nr:TIGR03016 family PEP-CTERM system-associated outer membrane protein [Ferribacterium limneticum]UCV17335.1 TIGR03016 family PEP-CTERM system-associated outer membrane protein [Ferribacterium limneticum]